ncbi:MAG: Holliday junction branch migration protein RuvA [Dehalococcoidia bacterium]
MTYIARLRGTIDEKGRDYVIIDAAGVGYFVSVPGSTLASLGAVGSEVKLRTFLYIREDAMQLYGFLTQEEQETFERLIGVSGIGPKGALSFLTQFSPAELSASVERRDAGALARVKGVGKRTAERLIIELQGKLTAAGSGQSSTPFAAMAAGDEALEALIALGYSAAEASAALAHVPPGSAPTGERVRIGLSALDRLRG